MAYEIVKDKPLPSSRRVGRPSIYPFAKMEVGDAFCVPGDGDASKWQGRMCSLAKQYVRNNAPDKKFATRLLDGDVWVWRIA